MARVGPFRWDPFRSVHSCIIPTLDLSLQIIPSLGCLDPQALFVMRTWGLDYISCPRLCRLKALKDLLVRHIAGNYRGCRYSNNFLTLVDSVERSFVFLACYTETANTFRHTIEHLSKNGYGAVCY